MAIFVIKDIIILRFYCCWITGQWPIIPALWEAKAGKSQGQEFKTNLANMVKPHLYIKYKKLAGCGSAHL